MSVEFTIEGLNSQQRVLADIIWACDDKVTVNKFIEGLPKPAPIETTAELPTLPAARANRRVVLDARTKKREARQRRLVEHLNDLQAKESD